MRPILLLAASSPVRAPPSHRQRSAIPKHRQPDPVHSRQDGRLHARDPAAAAAHERSRHARIPSGLHSPPRLPSRNPPPRAPTPRAAGQFLQRSRRCHHHATRGEPSRRRRTRNLRCRRTNPASPPIPCTPASHLSCSVSQSPPSRIHATGRPFHHQQAPGRHPADTGPLPALLPPNRRGIHPLPFRPPSRRPSPSSSARFRSIPARTPCRPHMPSLRSSCRAAGRNASTPRDHSPPETRTA